MSSFGVVLDACVLYPMYLRDTLLRAAEAGLFQPYWSADILDEVSRNIVADGRTSEAGAQRLLQMMRSAFPAAEVTGYDHLIASMLNDPKDRHVAAAAVMCGAEVIVTDNLDDFPSEALAPFNLEAQSADAFLSNLLSLAPDDMTFLIVAQAEDYTFPAMTAEELLNRLAKAVPTFARFVPVQLTHRP